jgi:AcrR family transcriptional regulator
MGGRSRKQLEPRKRPSQTRSRDTVTVILDAAARVFSRSGYAATTTNHIARHAGVSIGSIYEYFPGKDAILVALTHRHVDEAERALSAELASMVATPDLALPVIVERLVRAMVDLHARDPGLHLVLFEQAPVPAQLRKRIGTLEEALARAVAGLLQRHGIAADDALATARMAVQVTDSLTHRLVLHEVADGKDVPQAVDRQVREITLLLLGYLREKRLPPSAAR